MAPAGRSLIKMSIDCGKKKTGLWIDGWNFLGRGETIMCVFLGHTKGGKKEES